MTVVDGGRYLPPSPQKKIINKSIKIYQSFSNLKIILITTHTNFFDRKSDEISQEKK